MKAFINKVLVWFNGKKTIIGLLGVSILQLDLETLNRFNPDVKTILLWAFGILAAGGFAHKFTKNKTPKS